MVSVSITDGKLMLRVEGLDKALALKGSLEIPLDQVVAVRADPMVGLIRPDLTRAPGSLTPGSSKPGTFLESGLSFGLRRGHILGGRQASILGCEESHKCDRHFAPKLLV
jgi:hypothetical protein